jgi:hypothetical protein
LPRKPAYKHIDVHNAFLSWNVLLF